MSNCLRLFIALITVACTVTLAPSAAYADDAAEAQTLYQQGMDAYFAGKYADAIVAFKQAYQLDPNPIFLFNMSIAYEKAGNFDEALDEGWTAQESGQLPEQAAQINEARLPALGIIVRSVEVAGRVSGSAPCQSDNECRDGLSCNLSTNLCVDPATPSDGVAKNDVTTTDGPLLGIPFSLYGWIGAGLAVVGVGLSATALVIDLGLGSDIDEYNALSELDKRSAPGEALADDIEGRQGTGQVLLYSGAALVGVGAGLIVFDLFFNGGNEYMSNVDVTVGPDGAAVQASWTF
jgi:tetratricopeptide (TPR) repeat protein